MYTLVLNLKWGNHVILFVDKLEGRGRFHSQVKFKGGNVGLIFTRSYSNLIEIGYCCYETMVLGKSFICQFFPWNYYDQIL